MLHFPREDTHSLDACSIFLKYLCPASLQKKGLEVAVFWMLSEEQSRHWWGLEISQNYDWSQDSRDRSPLAALDDGFCDIISY